MNIVHDKLDKVISDNRLRIKFFTFFRELDLAIFILNNRRIIQRSLSLYPVLEQAIDWELLQYTVSDYGIHWPELDADLSLRGFFIGRNYEIGGCITLFPPKNLTI